jgi:hypothetical protein
VLLKQVQTARDYNKENLMVADISAFAPAPKKGAAKARLRNIAADLPG